MTSPTATAEIERLAREAPRELWNSPRHLWSKAKIAFGSNGAFNVEGELTPATAAYIAAVSPDVVLDMIAEHRAALEKYASVNSILRKERQDEQSAQARLKRAEKAREAAEAALRAAEAERDRLAAALDRIVREDTGLVWSGGSAPEPMYEATGTLGEIARAAIQSTSAKEGG